MLLFSNQLISRAKHELSTAIAEAKKEKYLTKEEAAQRYDSLKKWYEAHGHFWIGTGPYYLDKVYTTEKSLVLKQFSDSPDPSDRWAAFSEPKLASIQLDGPAQVGGGAEAAFDVMVSFKDQPYAQADIKQVKYILYDASGAVVKVGEAEFVSEGLYQVMLDAETLAQMPTGSARLEVAVVPIPVAVPAFTSIDFVVVP